MHEVFMVTASLLCVCRPGQRTGDDLEIIYDELLHIKALAHLSNTVSQLVCHSFTYTVQDAKNIVNTSEPHITIFSCLKMEEEEAATLFISTVWCSVCPVLAGIFHVQN